MVLGGGRRFSISAGKRWKGGSGGSCGAYGRDSKWSEAVPIGKGIWSIGKKGFLDRLDNSPSDGGGG
jgi:hypothetical protein